MDAKHKKKVCIFIMIGKYSANKQCIIGNQPFLFPALSFVVCWLLSLVLSLTARWMLQLQTSQRHSNRKKDGQMEVALALHISLSRSQKHSQPPTNACLPLNIRNMPQGPCLVCKDGWKHIKLFQPQETEKENCL